jgi:nitroimidazol reductase NimA-like FMN-containing flavoprotein (pyridoxamine 5'-phosphate oxidase superfamily)
MAVDQVSSYGLGMPSDAATDTAHAHASTMFELARVECLRLLASSHFGRVAVVLGEGPPLIRPLNYVFDERSQCVAFRTTLGSKLHGLLRSKEAAFEIDSVDPATRTGWSVVIIGVTEEVSDPAEVRRLETLGLDVWAPGHRRHWVRIRAWTVTGRRIVVAPSDTSG